MKRALVIMDKEFQRRWIPAHDYEFVANVHDEVQIECLPSIADEIGKIACEAIKAAGEYYAPIFRCELAGDYATGPNWKHTH